MSVATAVVVMAGVVMAVVVMAVVVMAVVLVLERGWRRRVSGRAAAGLAPRLRPAEDLRLGVRLVQLLRKALVRRLGRLIHRGKEGGCVACRGGGKRRAVVLAWRAGWGEAAHLADRVQCVEDALGAPLDDLDDVGVVRVRDGLPLDPVRLCEVGW